MTFTTHDSGMTRAEVRALTVAIQGGLCAICRAAPPTDADHDHNTGLLRGVLCASCNNRARDYGRGPWAPDVAAYLACPPATPFLFMWELPDWWTAGDTEAARAAGYPTVLSWVLSHPHEPARRAAAATEAAHRAVINADLPTLEGL
jgi:hypothetical protein